MNKYKSRKKLFLVILLVVIVGMSMYLYHIYQEWNDTNYISFLNTPMEYEKQDNQFKFELIQNEAYFIKVNSLHTNSEILNRQINSFNEETIKLIESQSKQRIKKIQERPVYEVLFTKKYWSKDILNLHLMVKRDLKVVYEKHLVYQHSLDKIIGGEDIFFSNTYSLKRYLNQMIDKSEEETTKQVLKNLLSNPYKYLSNFEISELGITLYNDGEAILIPFKEIEDSVKYRVENDDLIVKEEPVMMKPEKKVKEKLVAFTFDDGPYPPVDKKILESFRKYKGYVTYFPVGTNVDRYPEMIEKWKQQGHEIGNHTTNHYNLVHLSKTEIANEVKTTYQSIHKIDSKINPYLVRVPYGSYNQTVLETIDSPLIMWTVDSLDWSLRDRDKIVESVMNQIHDGAIVLLHNIYQETADAVELLLGKLYEQGYRFVTVSELYKHANIELIPHNVYNGIRF